MRYLSFAYRGQSWQDYALVQWKGTFVGWEPEILKLSSEIRATRQAASADETTKINGKSCCNAVAKRTFGNFRKLFGVSNGGILLLIWPFNPCDCLYHNNYLIIGNLMYRVSLRGQHSRKTFGRFYIFAHLSHLIY